MTVVGSLVIWLALLALGLAVQIGVPVFVSFHSDSWLAGLVAFLAVQAIWCPLTRDLK